MLLSHTSGDRHSLVLTTVLAASRLMTDWVEWHGPYADETSDLSRRRRSVQSQIHSSLDDRPTVPIRAVSACAGDGRDLLEVLAERDDAARVDAVLLETHPTLAVAATTFAEQHDLEGVEVRTLDAGTTDSYVGSVPADLVMFCGVFGNLDDDDLAATIRLLPQFCNTHASVLWTRGRFRSGDVTPTIRTWFAEAGFEEVSFDAPSDTRYRVGHHRYTGGLTALVAGNTFFTSTVDLIGSPVNWDPSRCRCGTHPAATDRRLLR